LIWDCHVHILPGLDDGPDSWDEAVEMARRAASSGTTHVVATPHYIPGVFEPDAALIRDRVREFRKRLVAAGVCLAVVEGCEVSLNEDAPDLFGRGVLMTLGDRGRLLVVELPSGEFPCWAENALFRLRLAEVTPVIAHPERNAGLCKDPALLGRLASQGVYVQLDAASLLGHWGRSAQRTAERWIRAGLVHMLGSDAHGPGSEHLDLRPALRCCARLGRGLEVPALRADDVRHLLSEEEAAASASNDRAK